MSTTPFGTPSTFGAPQQQGASATSTPAPNGAAQPDESPQVLIDENDPRLTSENLDVNVEGDAFAQPAPPPDGKYRAKLKLEGVQDEKGEKHNYVVKQTSKHPVVPYFSTNISAQIIDPSGKYDGITVYPPFGGGVGTLVQRDGSTKIATILSRSKRPDGSPWAAKNMKMTQKQWIDLFVQFLAGEPEIGIETAWEWSCQGCGEEAKAQNKAYPRSIVGMQNLPRETDAAKVKVGQTHSPTMMCKVNTSHGTSRARAVIQRFLSLEELKR